MYRMISHSCSDSQWVVSSFYKGHSSLLFHMSSLLRLFNLSPMWKSAVTRNCSSYQLSMNFSYPTPWNCLYFIYTVVLALLCQHWVQHMIVMCEPWLATWCPSVQMTSSAGQEMKMLWVCSGAEITTERPLISFCHRKTGLTLVFFFFAS